MEEIEKALNESGGELLVCSDQLGVHGQPTLADVMSWCEGHGISVSGAPEQFEFKGQPISNRRGNLLILKRERFLPDASLINKAVAQ